MDEVIAYCGVKGDKLNQVQRLLISDLNPQAVQRALNQLKSNRDFIPLSTSALARSRADWLYGMNMTRAYTIQGKKVGYQGVLSVGRVQTPLLGLVVRRDEEIEAFVPKPFYEVLAHLLTDKQQGFSAKWQPSAACEPYQDEEGRVLVKGLGQNVVERISGQPAQVTGLEAKDKRQAPPLPYSLSSLQIDAAKRFGLSAKEVLDTCQSLYERHKLITYPRSDSRHLPVEQFTLAPSVINAVLKGAPALISHIDAPNPKLKSKAWDDSKVEAHHAIIPTEKIANLSALSTNEARLYQHIARQYLAQFYPAYQYAETQVEVTIAGGIFTTKARQNKSLGWKSLFSNTNKISEHNAENNQEGEPESQTLPALKKGQWLECERGELLEKMTQAPKHFSDASLLSAMTGIGRFVTNVEIKKILKDTDGIGTEATRAGIIELLFKRGYLLRQDKSILATPVGRGLINSLPMSATTPDMTALWEASLDKISHKTMRYQSFMAPLIAQLSELIGQAASELPRALQGLASPSKGKGYPKKKSMNSAKSSRKYKAKNTKASTSTKKKS